jgi:hypothetical protein
MKIVGSKKLIKQLGDLPEATHAALRKSIKNNAKYGERKAKSLVPVDTGQLRDGINSQVYEDDNAIYGFINFSDNTKDDAIKVAAINYGRKTGRIGTGTRLKGTPAATGATEGYDFIGITKLLVAKRSANSIKRIMKKAIKDAMNG